MEAALRDRRCSLPVLPRASGIVPSVGRVEPRAVRLSITDRCDLACTYCRPGRTDGYLASESRLGPDDWETLVHALVQRGVERVRITGGEPLVHPRVVEIVARIARIPGVRDVALTTNGTRLAPLARALRDAGLRRVNVSLDSLDPARFARITRGGRLADVLAGFEAARDVGFAERKTNTVVLAGPDGNEDELAEIARFVWSTGATPRFLERMPVGEAARDASPFVPIASFRRLLAPLLAPSPAIVDPERGPARYVFARDGSGRRIGFIAGASESFCDGCDRLRVTSDGVLRPCLATTETVDARAAIASGAERALLDRIDEAWAKKPDASLWRGCAEPTAAAVSMCRTGG